MTTRHLRPGGGRSRPDPLFWALLGLAASLYLVDLDVSHWGNAYYTAAADAGAESWKAFLFGGLDDAGAATVDKPPLGLWPIALSVRAFGLSPWSVLVPQALMGVAAVALLHHCIRHTTGSRAAAFAGGLALAVTPVCTLMFRYNNPDALLVLLLLGSAACTLHAIESPRAVRWMTAAGLLLGLGFLTKMLEAFIIAPALVAALALFASVSRRRRAAALAAFGAATALACGWWVALVELWPRDQRPFVAGSRTDSAVDLALGYNGLDRLNGTGGGGLTSHGWSGTNLARIARTDVAVEVLWLLGPALVVALVAVVLTWRHSSRTERAAWVVWGVWLACATATFATMAGTFHSYYTVIMAPPICALGASGAVALTRERGREGERGSERHGAAALTVCLVGLVVVAVAAPLLLTWGLATAVWFAPVVVLGLQPAVRLLRQRGLPDLRWPIANVTAAAIIGPLVLSVATAALPHTGSGPLAGPGRGSPTALPVDPSMVDLLRDTAGTTWSAAMSGGSLTASYELATDTDVIAIGGYKGLDPYPGLGEFQRLVADGRVRYLVIGDKPGPALDAIVRWALTRYPVRWAHLVPYFDLAGPTLGS